MSITTAALGATSYLSVHTSAYLSALSAHHVGVLGGRVGTVLGSVLGQVDNPGGGGGGPQVCPQAPPGAQAPTEQLTGYVLWGVLILFVMGIIIGLGAVVAGRVFSMPHASKGGVVGVVVVLIAAVAYLVLPSMLDGVLGDGCI